MTTCVGIKAMSRVWWCLGRIVLRGWRSAPAKGTEEKTGANQALVEVGIGKHTAAGAPPAPSVGIMLPGAANGAVCAPGNAATMCMGTCAALTAGMDPGSCCGSMLAGSGAGIMP